MKHHGLTHPKLRRLARRLSISRPQAIGHLTLLWASTAAHAIAGDIGIFSDEEIAEECDWEGDPVDFVAALVETGWCDECFECKTPHRIVVHGWGEHAPDYVKKRLGRSGVKPLTCGVRRTTADNGGPRGQKRRPVRASLGRSSQGLASQTPRDEAPLSPAAQPADSLGDHLDVSSVGAGPGGEPCKSRPDPVAGSEATATLEALLASIEDAAPGSATPDQDTARSRRWLQELERLHTRGEPGSKGPGWPWATIQRVVAWLPTHERGDFSWGRVIRSASGLRKHFARILADLEAEAHPAPKRMSEIDRNLAEINERYRRSLDADDPGKRDEAGESVPRGGEDREDGCDDRDTDTMA